MGRPEAPRRGWLIVAPALLALGFALAAQPANADPDTLKPAGDWAVDPTQPGENLPPVGRSLFDHLVTRKGAAPGYHVPFPITALVKKIEAALARDASGAPPVKAVLLPLGRSLQRTAPAPDFFGFPRVVFAPDAEARAAAGHAGVLFKDRLYLGYQEKSDLIEVISYNEAAGRFEFQVVKDYRAGAVPQVFYANRAICVACHQNAAPIFSRALWDETNANPRVAAKLLQRSRAFYGVAPDRGVDIPYALDNATDRANLFAALQLLWRRGCDGASVESAARCRAALFTATLQHRLSGGQQFDRTAAGFREHFLPAITRNARAHWPTGLRIPSADVPNRNPLQTIAAAGPMAGLDVQSAFDPLAPREPSERWTPDAAGSIDQLVAGLAGFLAEADVRRLSEHLYRQARAGGAAERPHEAVCEVTRTPRSARETRIEFQCQADSSAALSLADLRGRLYVSADRSEGTIERLTLAARVPAPLRDLDLQGRAIASHSGTASVELTIMQAGTRARGADGNALASLRLSWTAPAPAVTRSHFKGRAVLTVLPDFEPVAAAVEEMVRDTTAARTDALADRPFRRARLMPELYTRVGAPALGWCCIDDTGMPPARLEPHTSVARAGVAADHKPAALQPFYRYCATCHQTSDRSPPNFLQGPPAAVAANLAHCAPRLHVRLAMWRVPAAERSKTPMPPHFALHGFNVAPPVWRESAELRALTNYVERALQNEHARVPSAQELLQQGYENLRACLPEGS